MYSKLGFFNSNIIHKDHSIHMIHYKKKIFFLPFIITYKYIKLSIKSAHFILFIIIELSIDSFAGFDIFLYVFSTKCLKNNYKNSCFSW